jgi:hypothetical protein
MQDARMQVIANGPVAQFVITRRDGQELSLSSDRGSLIHWNGGECVEDHGTFHRDPGFLIQAIQEFLKD